MSYEYFARPVTFAGPSTRLMRVPSSRDFSGHGYFGCAAGRAGACTSGTWARSSLATSRAFRLQGRREKADVGAAPADVAVERPSGLFGRRRRRLLEQRDGGHHEARRAEAAHERVVVAKCL